VHHYFFRGDIEDDWDRFIQEDRGIVAAEFEGREGVMFLSPSLTTAVEAWWMSDFWDLQQSGNNLNVVAPYKEAIELMIEGGFVPEELEEEFTPEKLALLEVSLANFVTTIVKGAATRVSETGGRIGIGDDLPMLITDANLLRPYYEGPGVGVSYETDAPTLPPPVPGGGEPDGPPGNTGGSEGPDDDHTRPAPGDDTPPPSSTPEETTTTTPNG
jgi:hypothetical protein